MHQDWFRIVLEPRFSAEDHSVFMPENRFTNYATHEGKK